MTAILHTLQLRIEQIVKTAQRMHPNAVIILGTVIFYCLLMAAPNNKLLFGISGLLLLFYFYLYPFTQALLLTAVSAFPVLSGKTYTVELIPSWQIPYTIELGLGYTIDVVITPITIIIIFASLLSLPKIIRKIPRDTHTILLLTFLLTTFVSCVFSTNQFLSFFSFVQIWQSGMLFILIRLEKHLSPQILLIIFSHIVIQTTIAILQFIKQGYIGSIIEVNTGNTFGYGTDEFFAFRPAGTFDHPNGLALFYVLTLPLLLIAIYKNKISTTWLRTFLFLYALLGITLTLSRGSWLTMLLILPLMIYYVRNKFHTQLPKITKKIFSISLPIAFVIIGFIAAPRIIQTTSTLSPYGSLHTRLISFSQSATLILQHPFIGSGLGSSIAELRTATPISQIFTPSPILNEYLLQATESGLFTVIIFIIFIFSALNKGYKSFKEQTHPMMNVGVYFALVGASINILFVSLGNGNRELFFILLGILL